MLRMIQEQVENEFTINKSKFITWLVPITDEKQAKEYIALARNTHPKAVHHCYAYIIKQDYQNIENQSDDGEPNKTAGMPMLDILRHENLINVIAIVTRYYGGIKLGVGGLIRAYGSSVKQAIDLATIHQATLVQGFHLECDYSLASIIEYEIKKHKGYIKSIDYQEHVNIFYYYKDESLNTIILEKTNNQPKIKATDRIYL